MRLQKDIETLSSLVDTMFLIRIECAQEVKEKFGWKYKPSVDSHFTETDMDSFPKERYDYFIQNDGVLQSFENHAEIVHKMILKLLPKWMIMLVIYHVSTAASVLNKSLARNIICWSVSSPAKIAESAFECSVLMEGNLPIIVEEKLYKDKISEQKGVGLRAKVDIEEGELILNEEPLLHVQAITNKVS
jgi:hypothetical protein